MMRAHVTEGENMLTIADISRLLRHIEPNTTARYIALTTETEAK